MLRLSILTERDIIDNNEKGFNKYSKKTYLMTTINEKKLI